MTFSDAERSIYTCPVTGRKYDPLALKRAIVRASKGDFNALVRAVPDDAAVEKLTAIARVAMGLNPIDVETGAGVLDADAYEALLAFTLWLKGKGPRAQSGPDSTPCTDCP